MERILVLNPGSTSTKLAVYEGESPLFTETIRHSPEELAPFEHVHEQYPFRRELVMDCLARHRIDPVSLDAVVSRGGLLAPIRAGAYRVNEDMVSQLRYDPQNEHPSNVGPMIAFWLNREYGMPAYIYDGITVDELSPINKLTGLPQLRRKGMGHNLNTRAAAMRYAREQGRTYGEITVIVAHLGGGITVNLHHCGRIIDSVNDEEGPFSPERTGGLPMFDLIEMCYTPGMTLDRMMKLVKRQGGLYAHLGTIDCQEVEGRIAAGDGKARLVYEAMALNTAKHIAKLAPDVDGKVDAVLLTGGIACSTFITDYIRDRVSFLAPVLVYPGEDEMLSLALGCLRVLRGQETAGEYIKQVIHG